MPVGWADADAQEMSDRREEHGILQLQLRTLPTKRELLRMYSLLGQVSAAPADPAIRAQKRDTCSSKVGAVCL